MACIDLFTKYAVVVPIPDNDEDNIASGLLECFNTIGKNPQVLYTDGEGGFQSNAMTNLMKRKISI